MAASFGDFRSGFGEGGRRQRGSTTNNSSQQNGHVEYHGSSISYFNLYVSQVSDNGLISYQL